MRKLLDAVIGQMKPILGHFPTSSSAGKMTGFAELCRGRMAEMSATGRHSNKRFRRKCNFCKPAGQKAVFKILALSGFSATSVPPDFSEEYRYVADLFGSAIPQLTAPLRIMTTVSPSHLAFVLGISARWVFELTGRWTETLQTPPRLCPTRRSCSSACR